MPINAVISVCPYTVITSPEVEHNNKQCEEQLETKENYETFLEKPPTHTVSHLPTCIYAETILTLSCPKSCLTTINAVFTHLLRSYQHY